MRRLLIPALFPLLFAACDREGGYSPILNSEPAADSVQTRMPRTLRLYYSALPDVERSSLRLVDPEGGDIPLRGLHTMAADDLMIEIMEPLANGDYAIHWTTVVADDPGEYSGVVNFSVKLAQEDP